MVQSDGHPRNSLESRTEPPAFNAPRVIIWLIAVCALVHFLRVSGFIGDKWLELFGFYSLRACGAPQDFSPFLVAASRIWRFVTYSFLHADWMHLTVNCVWMLAFGSVVARRLGAFRFLVLSAAGSAAGAALYLALYPSECALLIGASAAISAQVAATARLIFVQPFFTREMERPGSQMQPPLSLVETFTNRRALTFILLWLILNVLTGTTGIGAPGEGRIAWEAHLGGFLAGLIFLGFLDRRGDR